MNEKLEKMDDEMQNVFPNVNKLKQRIEQDKSDMHVMKKLLTQVQPGLAREMTYHSMKHDTLKNQILQNDIYKSMDNLEKKMTANE